MMRLILASLCILVLATLGRGAPPPPPPPPPTGPIAFHRIVMMWPKAFCHINRCTKPAPGIFTLHGVWPSFGGGISKTDCPGAPAFSTSVIAPIKKEMEFCWPNFINSNNAGFWKHEWDKHGSCSGMSVLEYFTKGVNECLSLQAIHQSILTVFSKKGIVPGPSKTYPPINYYNALVNYFGVTPEIRCKEKDGVPGVKYLFEIVFCVNLNFSPINCPSDKYLSGCGPLGGGAPSRTPINFL